MNRPAPDPGAAVATMDAATAARRLALLRLGSPSLPIGGYSYSQGLETAIDRGWIRDEAGARAWLADLLEANVGRFEAPLARALFAAIAEGDLDEAWRLHERYIASRETAELRAETLQMGFSMLQMLDGLDLDDAMAADTVRALRASRRDCALPMAWALAARAFGIDPMDALGAWLWAWIENQVMAAMKAVPLGQQAGQRLLSALSPALARTIERSATLAEDDWTNFAHGFAMAGSWHETQYSRLFRS